MTPEPDRRSDAMPAASLDPDQARSAAKGDIHTLESADRELKQHAKTSPAYVRAAVGRSMAEEIVLHKKHLMLDAFYDERAIEQVAGQHRGEHRLGSLAGPTVLILTAAGEAALCYAGLTLAVPDLSQAGGDPILDWIVSSGAALAALAIGVLIAVVTLHVGHQIKAAHRGVLLDPDNRQPTR